MKNPKQGRRIRTLEELDAARIARRSVLVKEGWHLHRYPAAYVMCRSAGCVLGMLRSGMFLYKPKKPIDPNAPPRKFKRKPEQPKPILNLPYYPDL
jgi:hypothetical protein